MAELRGKDGQLAIPTLVPPATVAPPARSSTTESQPHGSDGAGNNSDMAAHTGSEYAHAAFQDTPEIVRNSSVPSSLDRPALAPKAGTEDLLPATTRANKRMTLGRSRTSFIRNSSYNVPKSFPHKFEDTSSSSDSSDDDNDHKKNRSGSTSANHATKTLSERKKDRDARRKEDGPYSRFKVGNDKWSTKGKVDRRDGRLNVSINETNNSGYLAKALGSTVRRHFTSGDNGQASEPAKPKVKHSSSIEQLMEDSANRPRLNIVIIVIGSRGDIQPFVKIGKILKEQYGHRVRLATHPTFRDFVQKDSGLEFFSVGGDPSELMAFMVKNPGLIPSLDTVKAGEIGRRRTQMAEMFEGMWRACVNETDDEHDKSNLKMMGGRDPFVADAIIANPPSFAHVHIAEALGIPLHMMFTFPYTPTTQFPHPLANIKSSNMDPGYSNFMTYPMVELMTWQGLGDLINKFRVKTLGLEPVSTIWAPGQLYRFNVPYTYMWSPSLIPKPGDWGDEIEITGFVFLELADSFKPPDDLAKFLDSGDPPVYIGFGSIVVDDPDKFTKLIFEAVKMAGVRALVSKGWGGIGGDNMDVPDNIFLLDNTPHDWLFPKCSAVVHHGGAGTTAIGLKCAKPTMIVPFFGDQPFWGAMVAEKRAGAFECIPYKKLTAEKLAEGIKQCLTDEAKKNVKEIADGIDAEGSGAMNAVKSFHRSLPLRGSTNMRCSILENRVACWQLRDTNLRLSALAAEILVEQKKVKWSDLKLIRHYQWNDFDGAGEPISGITSAIWNSLSEAGKGIGRLPFRATKVVKKRNHHEEKKKKWAARQDTLREKSAHDDSAATSIPAKAETSHDNNGTPSHGNVAADHANEAAGHDEKPEKEEEDYETDDSKSEDKKSEDDKKLTDPDRSTSRPKNLQNRKSTQMSKLSALSEEPDHNLAETLAIETGEGFAHTGMALIKLPLDLSMALAQGFHNAPRLYGDSTVRVPRRIQGFHSGLRAGRDEFVYGIYDGVTGVVRLPIKGAKEDGIWGGTKGVAMGIGGLVLKDIAAIIGPPTYAVKGIEREMMKRKTPMKYLRKARISQGAAEIWAMRTSDERRKQEKSAAARQGGRFTMIRNATGLRRGEPKPSESKDKDDSKPSGKKSLEEEGSIAAQVGKIREPLSLVVARVERGWEILEAGQKVVGVKKAEGPFGKMRVRVERGKMEKSGDFESVGTLEDYMKRNGYNANGNHPEKREDADEVEKNKGKTNGVPAMSASANTQANDFGRTPQMAAAA